MGDAFHTIDDDAERQRAGRYPVRPIDTRNHAWVNAFAVEARKRAARSGMPYTLTRGDLRILAARSAGKCEISGILLDLNLAGGGRRNPFRPSIDRIDNAKGYEPGNVRVVCNVANMAMNEWGIEPVLKLARALVRTHYKNGAK